MGRRTIRPSLQKIPHVQTVPLTRTSASPVVPLLLLPPLVMSLEKTDGTEKSPLDVTVIFRGEDNLPPPPQLSEAEEKKLWRKVDLRLLPILTLLYLVSFIDKGDIFFVQLLGLLNM